MSDPEPARPPVEQMLARAVAGDRAAQDALLGYLADRLTRLTRRMLGDFRRVRRWAETDDVVQGASLRLVQSLAAVRPATPRDLLALASLQIRRELLDLARHYYGPAGVGANHHSPVPGIAGGPPEPRAREEAPDALAQWTELHEAIGRLPLELREVVELLFYQGLTQPEACQVLGLSLRTLQRRWHDAMLLLHRVWHGEGS